MTKKKGFIVERAGKLYVRVCYRDSLGKPRELMRRAKDKKHARELKKELVEELEKLLSAEGDERAALDGARLTFRQLADKYEAARLVPARYVNDRKVAGLRSLATPQYQLRLLVEHFGSARIRAITHSQIDEYRLKRLDEGLKIASVNRELTLLKTVFNFAKTENYMTRSPFETGASLISAVDEARRDRTLSRDEEERLLLALSSEDRAHVKSLVIAALDSGCRKSELLTLTWGDIDLVAGVIRIRGYNTKTMRERRVPISARLNVELRQLADAASQAVEILANLLAKISTGGTREAKDEGLVFDGRRLERIWLAALKDAGITGMRWHDMRHTFASRLAHSGLSVPELAALLGHTQYQTTLRYANPTEETIQKAANLLNEMHDDRETDDDTPGGYVN